MTKKSAAEMLTGQRGSAWRLNLLLPEAEYRYLYAMLVEHEPVSDVGRNLVAHLIEVMGDRINKATRRFA